MLGWGEDRQDPVIVRLLWGFQGGPLRPLVGPPGDVCSSGLWTRCVAARPERPAALPLLSMEQPIWRASLRSPPLPAPL